MVVIYGVGSFIWGVDLGFDMQKFDFGYRDVSRDEKSDLVADVFSSVASRYDVMNDVMSFGMHRYWKRVLLSMMVIRKDTSLLDVAGGSGDIARAALQKGCGGAVICDLTPNMLAEARKKFYDAGIFDKFEIICGDAEALPFADNMTDIYSIAFGLRNVVDRQAALCEAYRVLKPGGQFLCLEFCPSALPGLRTIYDIYSHRVIPHLGRMIANDADSYRYLVESIRRFPSADRLSSMMGEAGFGRVKYRLLSGGVVAIHSGYKIGL